MAADEAARRGKEIDALLRRLHSGCRRTNFEEGEDDDVASNDVSNLLRNASPPDETHAELGRALAHAHATSIRALAAAVVVTVSSSKGSSPSDREVALRAGVVDAGERIVRSLCRGEDGDNGGGDGATIPSEGANYASAAYAFFGHLRFLFSNRDEDALDEEFVSSQWHRWCVRCEELVFPTNDTQRDGGGGVHALRACLKNYACICDVKNRYNAVEDAGATNDGGCARIYESLTRHSSRQYLIRTCVVRAFDSARSNSTGLPVSLVGMMSPLFRSCILSARGATSTPHPGHIRAERRLLLQEILRGCDALLHRASVVDGANEKHAHVDQVSNMIQYLAESLASYLRQGVRASFLRAARRDGREDEDAEVSNVFELGYDWLSGICDLTTKLAAIENNDAAAKAACASTRVILSTVLPQFAPSSATAFDMAPIYSSLASVVGSLPRRDEIPTSDHAAVALRLGTLLLGMSDDDEASSMCDLILATFARSEGGGDGDDDSTEYLAGGVLTAVGCVLRLRPACRRGASRLKVLGESMLRNARRREREEGRAEGGDGTHLMDILGSSLSGEAFRPMMNVVAAHVSDVAPPHRPLSSSDQRSALLLGLSLLHASVSSSSRQPVMDPNGALAFLRSFLRCYPRQASRIVPSVVDVARTCLTATASPQSPPATLLACLEFLASPCVSSDPHGAHLAWTFLSPLADDGSPPTVRSSVLRLLPSACAGNRRLSSRVSDVVGRAVVSRDPIVRVAASAALAELARRDLLRDVERAVGLVQGRLADDEPAAAYHALETLRHLVANDELEFDLVIRVLEKRLAVDLSDTNAVRNLDALVLEALVALLGEGGLEEEDDESDVDEDGEEPEVSPQSVKAVSLLVELALSTLSSIEDDVGPDGDASFFSDVRIQRKIYGSLSGYSSQVLGLDEESIRSWNGADLSAEASKKLDPEIQRFLHLKQIVLAGLNFATQLSAREGPESSEIAADMLESVAKIGSALLTFEEEVHGSFLFRGGGFSAGGNGSSSSAKSSSKGNKAEGGRTRASKSVLSSLPSASGVREMYESDPRSSSAAAVLYSIGSSANDADAIPRTEDLLAQMSECFGDIGNEPLVDPAFRAIQACSLMNCMGAVWKSIRPAEESVQEELLDQVVSQTEEWSDTYGEEYAYVAMAAFALAIDDSAQCWPGATKIQRTILDGQENYLFESEDAKLLCLSMIAAGLCRAADARVTGLIDSIERSLIEHGQKTCFGALFGLGVIVANLTAGNINGTDPSDTWRRQQAQRIVCILLSALNSCLEEENDVVLTLISSIESGETPDDLSRSCSNLESLFVRDGATQRMKAIMIGLSHSFTVLVAISSIFSRCVVDVIEKLPWGFGKSSALYAAYKTAMDSGAMEQKDLSESIASASGYVQESSDGFGDALLSLASLSRLSSEKNQRELDLVAKTCRKTLLDRNASVGGEEKIMSILAACGAIGNLPGASFTPNVYAAVKKNFVVDIVKILEEVAMNDSEDLKYRDAATIGLGVLCAMSKPSDIRNKMRKNTAIQAKDGTVMQGILQEVEKLCSLICTPPSRNGTNRAIIANKLCALFSMLEPIAMPGHFSRVIELTLNDSPLDQLILKASATKLLVSQLDPARRRIGFDGRGFVDLSTRLAKMSPRDVRTLVGSEATPIVAKLLQNLIYQIPTSIGEDVTKSLWAICRSDSSAPLSSQSMTEFLIGLKNILLSVNTEEKPPSKRNISPALLRSLQKIIVTEIFSDLCTDGVSANQTATETVWTTYLRCVELVPSATVVGAGGLNRNITDGTAFGMAVCASLSANFARKVESWIALQKTDQSFPNLQNMLLSTLAIAAQAGNNTEMKESVSSIFEVVLVKGIDTMALYLLAAKIAFFWESRRVHQLRCIDLPIWRVSEMSSFFVTRNLFCAQTLSPEQLLRLFNSFVRDLPSKLAVLCEMWKISGDVSNRASRIGNANHDKEESGTSTLSNHRIRSLTCFKEIVQLIEGGEI